MEILLVSSAPPWLVHNIPSKACRGLFCADKLCSRSCCITGLEPLQRRVKQQGVVRVAVAAAAVEARMRVCTRSLHEECSQPASLQGCSSKVWWHVAAPYNFLLLFKVHSYEPVYQALSSTWLLPSWSLPLLQVKHQHDGDLLQSTSAPVRVPSLLVEPHLLWGYSQHQLHVDMALHIFPCFSPAPQACFPC